ncbi:glycosyltransferase family 2 protein [Oceanibacterium hippocampi]
MSDGNDPRPGARELSPDSALELAVIVPTFNEAGNVEELVRRLDACLDGRRWEVIFVDDDSTDGTADAVRAIGLTDSRVRCLQRIGRRGLSSACIEGMLATAAPLVAVMDGDLQHDEALLPRMMAKFADPAVDIVVGSRYVDGGGVGDWDSQRVFISRAATWLARRLTKVSLSDPMSGFFMLRRPILLALAPGLSGIGFKILLDILSTAKTPLRVRELGFQFRTRHAGESKLSSAVAFEYLAMLVEKTFGAYIPARFVMFSVVGGLGVFVHMAVLYGLFRVLEQNFGLAQTVATLVAMTFNFALNNLLTYRDRQLRGWRLLTGWLSFCLACSVGAIANIGVAVYLFEDFDTLWIWSGLAGVLVGAVWNYAVTSVYTWKARR